MHNVKFNRNSLFTFCLFKLRKMKKTKLLLKSIKVFNLSDVRCNSRSCQVHAAHGSFILLWVLLEKRQNINFWKLVRAGFHPISTCRPV